MHGANPLCIAAQSSRFTSSHQVVGQRTESDRTANGIRLGGVRKPAGGAAVSAAPTEQAGTFARLVHFLLGWCAYCSVGALETSAPPKRHQHLCRSVKSVGLILSKSEFHGSSWQGVQLFQLHQPSKRREYSHRIRGTHRTVWRRCAAHR